MTETTHEGPQMVQLTIVLPQRLENFYDDLVSAGLYRNRQDAMSHGLVESLSFEQGSYHNLRLDVHSGRRPNEDSHAPETGEREEGDGMEDET